MIRLQSFFTLLRRRRPPVPSPEGLATSPSSDPFAHPHVRAMDLVQLADLPFPAFDGEPCDLRRSGTGADHCERSARAAPCRSAAAPERLGIGGGTA